MDMNPIFVKFFCNSPKKMKLVKTFNSNITSESLENKGFDEIEITPSSSFKLPKFECYLVK